MNVPLRIARRYFLAHNKRSFISIIALIAMIGVGVGTMAMVVVLSVFNGMEELNRQIFKTFDADIQVTPREGRRFVVSSAMLQKLGATKGVAAVTQVIEDNALARYRSNQTVVRLKGVDSTFVKRGQLDTAMIEGNMQLMGPDGTPFALVADGVRGALLVSLNDILTPLELWYPRNDRKTLSLSSPDAFNQVRVRAGGTFFIESRYDDYIIAPLETVAKLLQFGAQRTSLEVQLRPDADADVVQSQLSDILGEKFMVQNRDELNADLLRAIRVEKLFVTVTLAFIILVAATNIFFSLSMLAIEKKEDIRMLSALGATAGMIRQIFLSVGGIVALSGAVLGLIFGVGLCWLQQRYGLVSMGTANAIVDVYPVRLIWGDVFLTALIIVLITVGVSYIPARRAARSVDTGMLA